ncbi:YCF48-related protein [Halopseudomonas sp. Lyrl_26]|uniref:WD40/YVTN/BNR-like repeat-containing protein n=1 Tax=Halopseudomonas sp. Lyrl_26 TaxID=3110923 RepID=UPI003F81FAA4
MYISKSLSWAVLALAVLVTPSFSYAAGFNDPLDQAAFPSELASQNLLLSVTEAGNRLVAVGQRGHIIYSDDQGGSWKQATVPVSTDLTAVCFVDATTGWAVGHDGVILHSRDSGVSWSKQLDGRQANTLLVDDLTQKVADGNDVERMQRLLAEAIYYRDSGPDKPFLDVWFSDAQTGYAVGAYNLIFYTEDGGQNWQPWFDRTDNPYYLHFNAISGDGDQVYIVGERGLFLSLDKVTQRFIAKNTPYSGSFFSLAVTPNSTLVLGMRGNAYRTMDEGMTWHKLETGVHSGLSGATVLNDGRVVVVSQGGQALLSTNHGLTFESLTAVQAMPFADVSQVGASHIAVVGTQGVRIEPLR